MMSDELPYKRIPLNSESLREKFPEVYSELFSCSSVVCSVSREFTWSGEYAEMFGGMNIMQKIPSRVFVGLEPTSIPEIKIGLFKSFIPSQGQFINSVFNNVAEEEICNFIKKEILPQFSYNGHPKGFNIHLLTELPLEVGLGSVGSIAAALAGTLYLYFSQVEPEIIKTWSKKSAQDLINNKDLKFQEIHRLAWKIETVLDLFPVSGVRSFTSLIDGDYPIIYFTKKDSVKQDDINDLMAYTDLSNIDQTKYWAFRMGELFNFKSLIQWPVDFGLIFSGEVRISGNIIRSIANTEKVFEDTTNYINQEFKKYFEGSEDDDLPFFIKISQEERGRGLWNRYMMTLSVASMMMLKGFKDLFSTGESDRSFFRAIDLGHSILKMLDVSTPTIDFIRSYIYRIGRENFDDPKKIAVKLTGAGKGGDVLFTVPYGTFRNNITEIINGLKKETKKDIFLDYASWIDGYGSEGLIVEQHLDKKIFSQYLSEGVYKLKHLNKQAYYHSELMPKNELNKIKNEVDVIIDAEEEEIYVKGHRLDSHDIHSASTTIKIVRILLDNFGKTVSNSELPESSYSLDRNEFQGKIVTPLIKAIEKYANKKLDFVVKGGLTEFKTGILNGHVEFYVIEE